MRIVVYAVILAFGLSFSLGESAAGTPAWADRYIRDIYDNNNTITMIPGLRLTYPQGVAVSAAAFFNVEKIVTGKANPRGVRGLLLQAEAGYGGVKYGVGVGSIDTIGYSSGLKLSHYRAWTDFASMDSGEQYIGLDATLSGFLSSFTLGVYTGVNDEASDFLCSAGWGFGF